MWRWVWHALVQSWPTGTALPDGWFAVAIAAPALSAGWSAARRAQQRKSPPTRAARLRETDAGARSDSGIHVDLPLTADNNETERRHAGCLPAVLRVPHVFTRSWRRSPATAACSAPTGRRRRPPVQEYGEAAELLRRDHPILLCYTVGETQAVRFLKGRPTGMGRLTSHPTLQIQHKTKRGRATPIGHGRLRIDFHLTQAFREQPECPAPGQAFWSMPMKPDPGALRCRPLALRGQAAFDGSPGRLNVDRKSAWLSSKRRGCRIWLSVIGRILRVRRT